MAEKRRADVLLVERGLVPSRNLAQRLILSGQVWANGQPVPKPSTLLPPDATIEIRERPRYVSRGGEKLEAALRHFQVDVQGKICADVGASTGGFTDCLLQYGAAKVYAIDVGYGQLHWRLRQDPRVVVMEKTNARYLEALPEPVDLVTVDVSFISLRLLFPAIRGWYGGRGGVLLALIKPQFEAGPRESARGKGVIRNPAVHRQVLREVVAVAHRVGFHLQGLMPSPIRGAKKGNIEFWGYFVYNPSAPLPPNEVVETWVTQVVQEAHENLSDSA